MKIHPKDIARSLIDSIASASVPVEHACDSAIALLKRACPGVSLREFAKVVEREVNKRKLSSSALLVVPHEHAIKADAIEPLLSAASGKKVRIDRNVEEELIGGAVLLVDHRRIDCSIQGALAALLRSCLQPLD